MKRLSVLAAAWLPFLMPGFAQSASSASGNGPFVVPTSSAYADLDKVVTAINNTNSETLKDRKVIFYDPQTFGTLPMYPSAVDQAKDVLRRLCARAESDLVSAEAAADVLSGAGTAASGLAALLGAVTPAYAIQGQAFTIDNNALIAAFLKARPDSIIPAYLAPAAASSLPECGEAPYSRSFAALWAAAAKEAVKVRALFKPDITDAQRKLIQDALDYYQAMRDAYLAADKGPSLYSKLSVAETLWDALNVTDVNKLPVILDMKIDSAGIDSSTRTILFWKKTTFSDNLLVHYFLFTVTRQEAVGTGAPAYTLQLAKADTVNVITRDQNEKTYIINPGPDDTGKTGKKTAKSQKPQTAPAASRSGTYARR